MATKVSKVEKELQEAGRVSPKKGEDRQKYLERLRTEISEVPEKEWDELSKGAQDWYQAATVSYDKDKPIEDFEGAESDETETAKDGDNEKEDKKVSTKKNGNGKPAAKDEEKPAKAPAKKAAAKDEPKAAKKKAGDKPKKDGRGEGKVEAILAHVLKNPKDGADAIVEALEKDGVDVSKSTAATVRSAFRIVAKFLNSKKLLTKELF